MAWFITGGLALRVMVHDKLLCIDYLAFEYYHLFCFEFSLTICFSTATHTVKINILRCSLVPVDWRYLLPLNFGVKKEEKVPFSSGLLKGTVWIWRYS